MQPLITSDRIVDGILALVVIEIVVLGMVRIRRGAGPGWRALVPNLLAGAALLLALRAALTGAAWPWVPLWLAVAGVAHVADLHFRWREASR